MGRLTTFVETKTGAEYGDINTAVSYWELACLLEHSKTMELLRERELLDKPDADCVASPSSSR